MLNHLHMWCCETSPIKAAGFNSAKIAAGLQYAAQWASVYSETHKDSKETICINNILQNVSIFKDEASDFWEL